MTYFPNLTRHVSLLTRTGLDHLESQRKKTLDASKTTCEISTNKIKPTSNSKHYGYFTEQLMHVTKRPPREFHKELEKLESVVIEINWTPLPQEPRPGPAKSTNTCAGAHSSGKQQGRNRLRALTREQKKKTNDVGTDPKSKNRNTRVS
jgi:hypothetical protein